MDRKLLEKMKADLEARGIKSILVLKGGIYTLLWKDAEGKLGRIVSTRGVRDGKDRQ